MKKVKLPTDLNKKAKAILDLVTGEDQDTNKQEESKNPAAVELGRLGGLKGGKARASNLSAKAREDIARKAANTRWSKK